ncbi:MAG: pyridoxal phosphate-dependent aminotransferase [Prevotellaceae bacterium]|jgi:aspartate/methionine/tyrosine aminotransferase|nr:pyridoxal phosphate-dependent aminotransferase [Prevotellaceae bacterium]
MNKINPQVKRMKPFIVMDILEKAQEMRREGLDIIHLEVGEPDFDTPGCVTKAAIKAFEDGHTHYSHSLGDIELRRAICGLYNKEYGVKIDPEQVVITSGSSPAILMVLMLLGKPDNEFIYSNPGYACYQNFIWACNARAVPVPLHPENGFRYDIDEVKKYITSATAGIMINSPMNPVGNVIDADTLKELARLDIPVISDEIYHGLVYEGKAHSILEFTDNAFVLNGFSKRFAMTGLRLGYLIAPKKYMRALQTLQQNLFICAPSITQKAGLAALQQSEKEVETMRQTYNERRLYMVERLKKMGLDIPAKPTGAFYVFCDVRKFTGDSYRFAFDILENARVGVTPGIDFGSEGEGFIRLSYANSIENIKEGLNRLENYLKKLQ